MADQVTPAEPTVRRVMTKTRVRRDLCPGVTRPWLAKDGALVRLRLVGGRLTTDQLKMLAEIAARYGDGDIHLWIDGIPAGTATIPASYRLASAPKVLFGVPTGQGPLRGFRASIDNVTVDYIY